MFGENEYDTTEIGSTMGLVAFSLMLVVAAFESRDEKASILRTETFDNKTLNITALVEIALAVLIARGGVLTNLLGTADPAPAPSGSSEQFRRVLLFVLWELGKAVARRREDVVEPATLTQPVAA